MKRVCMMTALLLAVSCGTTAPSLEANIVATGTVSVVGCASGGNNLFTCASFSGPMINNGPGCAANIHGTTITFIAGTTTQIGSTDWTFGGILVAGQAGTYTGGSIVLPGPLVGGWTYATQVTFTSVKCS